jgi:hypothetical protein
MRFLRLYLTVIICFVGMVVDAQQLDIPQLQKILEQETFEIDTVLKTKGYLLLEKDVDSTTTTLYYNHVQQNPTGPSWVRSLTMMDVHAGNIQSRLIKYRTYNKEEYLQLNTYLLYNNYKTKGKFDFGNEEHVLYTNGKSEIRIKTIQNKLQDGRLLKSYEFEVGK